MSAHPPQPCLIHQLPSAPHFVGRDIEVNALRSYWIGGHRGVLADDDPVGVTNHTLMLPADEYTISLDGAATSPPSQDVILAGTSLVRPKVVTFAPA